MNDEVARLQTQLDRLSDELSTAQKNIRKLEKRDTWRPNALALTCFALVIALGISLFGAKASSENERKEASALSSDVPTKVKAPFEVDDQNGQPIMIVREDNGPNGSIDRGVYIFNEARQAVIHLRSTSDDGGGGRIRVGDGITGATTESGIGNGVEIGGTQQKSGVQIVRQGKKVVSIGGEQYDKYTVVDGKQVTEKGGAIQVFDSSEKPIATLNGQKAGGSLTIFGSASKPIATLDSQTDGGSLKLYNSNNKTEATLDALKDGGSLKIQGADSKTQASLDTQSDGGSLKLFGTGEKKAVTLESKSDGGSLSIFNTAEKAAATLSSDASEGKLAINDKSGELVATVVAGNNGGIMKVSKAGDQHTFSSMNAVDEGLGVLVRKAGARVAFMGSQDGQSIVYVFSGSDSPTAGLLASKAGKGVVAVYNNLVPIAFLTESDKHDGGGSVTVTDPAGNGVFSAGYSGDGGEACLDRKGTLKCLGIGLPLQIN